MLHRLPVLLSVLLASCIYDSGPFDDGAAADDPEAVYMSFTLSTAGASTRAASRGAAPDDAGDAWADGYVPSDAVEFEERILRDRFCAAFYDTADGSYLGRLDNIICSDYAQSASGGIYEFHGTLRLYDSGMTVEKLRTKSVRMMVAANMPAEMPDALLGEGLRSVGGGLGSLTSNYAGREGDFEAIPMWGVCTASLRGIEPGEVYDMGSISLLRSMAKIEVCVKKDATPGKLSIESVTVANANTSGCVLPGKWNELAKTEDLKFGETLRIPDKTGVGTMRFHKADANGAIVFYLPECRNAQGDSEVFMTVGYTLGGESHEGIIRFCPYTDDGAPVGRPLWDIVRNHHYKYEIAHSESGGFLFRVRIEDMEKGGEWTYEY